MGEKGGDQIQVVKIEGEGVKSVANLLMILVVAFVMTTPVAIYAIVAVEDYKATMDKEMDDLRWSNRQNSYWCERAEVAMTTHGFDVPLPSQRKDRPK